jgi:GDP-L-fucose synthase
MLTNLYGPNDNYDLQNSHVLPALIRKFTEARKRNSPFVEIWGTGNPKREFLHVDDLAEACLFLMENYNEAELVNVGTGEDLAIRELAFMIKEITGYKGDLKFDASKPDGTFRKLLDVSKIHRLGWKHKIGLREGIEKTYETVKDLF